jgi:NADH-quinone oxidoreductase subunit J
MDILHTLFWVFTAFTLVSGWMVITAKNPVHAVLYLVLAFFSSACLWLLLQAEFLAIALVLVYVGAVMVLFLFVVMMLNLHIDSRGAGFWRHMPVAFVVGVAIALQLWLVLAGGQWQRVQAGMAHAAVAGADALAAPGAPLAPAPGNTAALGHLTFTQYLLPLQLAGAILLVAMIAAIALTHRRRSDTLRQSIPDQVAVRAKDRLRMVSMPSARPAPEPAPMPGQTPAKEG